MPRSRMSRVVPLRSVRSALACKDSRSNIKSRIAVMSCYAMKPRPAKLLRQVLYSMQIGTDTKACNLGIFRDTYHISTYCTPRRATSKGKRLHLNLPGHPTADGFVREKLTEGDSNQLQLTASFLWWDPCKVYPPKPAGFPRISKSQLHAAAWSTFMLYRRPRLPQCI